jgi:6,7-dimethyl-8-ribityllumazine synthase
MTNGPHMLIIEARFYDEIADDLLKGARGALEAKGATSEVISVPGILELPLAAQLAFSKGATHPNRHYDGFVVLGCAVKGETDHYEYVCDLSMSGVQRVSLDLLVPVGNGILTCPTWELAQNRANPAEGDAGGRAAKACLRLIELKRCFGL